jgi:DNA-3-methyladenine glycosylase II
MHTVERELRPVAPFSFAQTLGFLGEFPPLQGEQQIRDDVLTKAIRVHQQTVVFRVRSLGTVDDPLLRCELFSAYPLDRDTVEAAFHQVGFALSLYDDLNPFYDLARKDSGFAQALARLYGLHQVKFLSPFENACWAILTQRTSMAVARSWKAKLTEKYGGSLEVDGRTYEAFPEAADLLAVDPAALDAIVGTLRKAEYLRSVIEAFAAVDREWLETAPSEFVEKWLLGIKGLGEWSAMFVLVRGLGRTDKGLLTDREGRFTEEVMRAAKRVYDPNTSTDDVYALAKHYGDWQGYWVYYMRAAG